MKLVAYVIYKPTGESKTIEDSDYSSKINFRKDLEANEYKVLSIKDEADLYVMDHSDYTSVTQIKRRIKELKRDAEQYPTLYKSEYDKLVEILNNLPKLNEETKLDEGLFDKKEDNKISKYSSIIQDSLIPAFNEKYNVHIKKNPLYERPTALTYLGYDQDNNRIIFEFNSSYKDETGKLLTGTGKLFASAFFNFKGNKAGEIDLNNIDEAVEVLYSTLYELGFRTEQDKAEDIEKDKQAKIDKEKEKERKRQEDMQKARDKYNQLKNTQNDDEKENNDDDVESYPSYSEAVKSIIKTYNSSKQEGTNIHITYDIPNSENKDVFSIDVTSRPDGKSYVKSEYLNLDKDYSNRYLPSFLTKLENNYKPRTISIYSPKGEIIDNFLWTS